MNSFTPRPSGLHAHVFRPPESPASYSASPSHNAITSTDYFSSHRSRKRQRPDSAHGLNDSQNLSTPWNRSSYGRSAETPSWIQCPTPSDAMYGSACAQSSALVNERYALKGGMDTPGLMATAQEDGVARYAGDLDFRRRVRDADERKSTGGALLAGPLARERNGVARMQSSPNGSVQASAGWTGLALGLVGKVFTFGTSVIKGFYAGGGKGYDLDRQRQSSPPMSWMRSQRYAGGGTPVPGQWQDDGDFLGDFEQDNPSYSPSSITRPPNKRRQTDKDSWVMVGTPDETPIDTTPRRKTSSNAVPRSNLAPRPSLASRANSRRSLAPVSRRASSHAGSPALQLTTTTESPNRRASMAPMRSPRQSRPSSSSNHPSGERASLDGMSPEVEKYVKRQAKQEKAADRTMSSMNRQLKDLIQQAQAALGTKFAVEGEGEEDVDEGFVDEEW
ncbi:uncharacterized protein LTR77_007588 [Saxophila tyrrhenica]|uniref:Uncharacterized protein n=1 Tax=Saxophila tyrrhenica TaxID=1690608 RepID=A0AAV9P2H5_9PEZI|nr:hypothetical protein LTR77_007588 [Saxophila tyrrhenica]